MNNSIKEVFLLLVRVGLGLSEERLSKSIDWQAVESIADQHGLSAIVLDGIERMRLEGQQFCGPDNLLLARWRDRVSQNECVYLVQQKASVELALLFHDNTIRTYVLKGAVFGECYPKSEHRASVDMDCYLLPESGAFDAWTAGNDIIMASGFVVTTNYYKNSTFYLPGLTVENHRFLTPFRGNKKLKRLEKLLQSMILEDQRNDNAGCHRFEGTWLFRPPVLASALFFIEHAYSHFLHEGLTLRHFIDWMMFRRCHIDSIDWPAFNQYIDEFGFRLFYDAYVHVGEYILGECDYESLSSKEQHMIDSVWLGWVSHETVSGVRGKMNLVMNTLRASWKYRDFSPISMIHALLIQVNGVLFNRRPTLD